MGWFSKKKDKEDKKKADEQLVKVSDDSEARKQENKEAKKQDNQDDNAVAEKKKDDFSQKKAGKSMKELYSDSGKSDDIKKVIGSKKGTDKKKKYGNAYRILIKPLITEKATNLGGQNKYIFAVAREANKIEITKAIEEVYGVKPESINIINMSGKEVRQGRAKGRRKDWKKAIVTLPEGKNIKVYEGV